MQIFFCNPTPITLEFIILGVAMINSLTLELLQICIRLHIHKHQDIDTQSYKILKSENIFFNKVNNVQHNCNINEPENSATTLAKHMQDQGLAYPNNPTPSNSLYPNAPQTNYE